MATVIEIIFFMKVVSQWSSSSDGGYLLRKIFLQALARFQLSGTTIYDCHLLSSSVLLILLPHPVIFISSRTQHARVHHSHITKHQFWARWQFFCLQIINITTLPHDRRLVKISEILLIPMGFLIPRLHTLGRGTLIPTLTLAENPWEGIGKVSIP